MATTTPRTPEETQAISRLRALGQGVRVYCLERDRLYCVPSASNDGSAYQVQVSGESAICSCPAGENDRMCKHLAAAEMYREAQDQLEHAPPPPRTETQLPPRPAARSRPHRWRLHRSGTTGPGPAGVAVAAWPPPVRLPD